MTAGVSGRGRAGVAGLIAVGLVLAWQFVIVHYTFGGNWTAWFCTGGNLAQPPLVASEHLYAFEHSDGYDGQFYHYIAHDPLFRRGLDRCIDAARLRYRRILMPGLAYLLAAGQDRAIDAALIAVNLLAFFAGVYWSSRYFAYWGYNTYCGLLFLLVPTALVSMDRMVVDLVFAALTMGFALYVTEERPRATFVVLVLAPLARETGLVLVVAYCVSVLINRRFSRFLVFACSLLPTLAWYLFVNAHTAPEGTKNWFTWVPLAAMLDRMTHLTAYPFVPVIKLAAQATDVCAFLGVLVAFLFAFYRPAHKLPAPIVLATYIMAAAGIMLGPPVWIDVFAFGRVLSPLLMLIALQAFPSRAWARVLPLALVDPRISLQLGYKLFQVVRALLA